MQRRKPTISPLTNSGITSSSDESPFAQPPPFHVPPGKASPPGGPTVLTAEQAAALVASMADMNADHCALCGVSFTEEIPPEPAMFGGTHKIYPVNLCHQCKERYENCRIVGKT